MTILYYGWYYPTFSLVFEEKTQEVASDPFSPYMQSDVNFSLF